MSRRSASMDCSSTSTRVHGTGTIPINMSHGQQTPGSSSKTGGISKRRKLHASSTSTFSDGTGIIPNMSHGQQTPGSSSKTGGISTKRKLHASSTSSFSDGTGIIPNMSHGQQTPGSSSKTGGNSTRRKLHASSTSSFSDAVVQDDDLERRSHFLAQDSSDNSMSSISMYQESFKRCMQLFTENKITKHNVWHLNLINTMHQLVRRNDACMDDLQVASTSLDASTKIYGLRVDSVHADAVRLASDLARGVKRAVQENTEQHDGDDNSEGVEDNRPKRKRRKLKRSNHNVVMNLELLNGRLDTVKPLDRLFNNRATTLGDCNQTKDLFQATLYTDPTTKMMEMRSEQFVSFKNCDQRSSAQPDPASVPCVNVPHTSLHNLVSGLSVNPSLKHFSFIELESDDNQELLAHLCSENMDMAFDMNKKVIQPLEQLASPENMLGLNNIDYCTQDIHHSIVDSDDEGESALVNLVQNSSGSLNKNDLLAAIRSTKLDYSYRHTAELMIRGLWAGPNHWKIKPIRIAGLDKANNKNSDSQAECNSTVTSKSRKEMPQVDVNKYVDPSVFLPGNNTKLKAQTILSWNPALLTIPECLNVEERLMYAFTKTNMKYRMVSKYEDFEDANENEAQNVDEDCNNDGDLDVNDLMTGDVLDNHAPDAAPIHNDEGCPINDANIPDSDLNMVEVPHMIKPFAITYSKEAKNINMRKLKECTWKILQETLINHSVENALNVNKVEEITFPTFYWKLKERLDTVQSANLSVSLAVLAVLHVATEHSLELTQNECEQGSDDSDFTIKMPPTNCDM